MATEPSKFLEGTHIQWAWDSQDLGTAKECPRKRYYQSLRGLRRRTTNTNQQFGAAFHKARETFELKLREPDGSVASALTAAHEAATAESVTMEDKGAKTRDTLHRTIDAYATHYANDPTETILTTEGKPAVELQLSATMAQDLKYFSPIEYFGYIDRLVRFNGVPVVMDHKTTSASIATEKGSKAYFLQWQPDLQFSGYVWLANMNHLPVKGVLVDAIQIAKTKNEFARAISYRTDGVLAEWKASALDTIYNMRDRASLHIGMPIEDAAHFYPMNEKACHTKYRACPFAGICSKDPAVRESFLSTDFEVKPWNPLALRNTGTIDTEADDEAV